MEEEREEDELDSEEIPTEEEGGNGYEDGSNREEAEEGAGPLLRPSVLDIQLALERLCEDQSREQPSESDGPDSILETDPEQYGESISRLHSPGKIVNELFKEAKEHGALTAEEASKSSPSIFHAKSFTGGGYKLGDSSIKQSEYIQDDDLFSGGPDVQILLKLWSNGFSIDDGELRPYSDPVNAQFLDSIKRGLTPEIISTPSSPEEEHKPFLNAEVELDEHVPTTKIQIRLADGTRLIQRFNLSHRIMDIRSFIIQSRPEFAQTDFILVTTFPNTDLTDENQTLEEADLLNTVLLQRLK
ncbi:UBX domain-containing protein 2B isoform X2 [Hyperolius riggenbachi]|uniref:UBX domain-containing protein 2B isoform X2 n=1 Tax=Hyperolius riggenbachi TaxID=752182 RepID=UPI0035A362B1